GRAGGGGGEGRKRVGLRGSIGSARIAVDVVGDAVLAQQAPRLLPAPGHLPRAELCERGGGARPVGARGGGWSEQAVAPVEGCRARAGAPRPSPRRRRRRGP